jgi:transcriptional regulator of acetoin/glycerol metabolism
VGQLVDQKLLLVAARAGLLDGVDPDMNGIPDHIAASWRRAVSSGVDPDEVSSTYHSDVDVESRLVRCAQPVMEALATQIADMPMSIALTDDQARLVARRDGNSWMGRLLDRVYFAQGFDFAEGSVATNGVGTVLEFGSSVHIVGAEHFVEPFQAFACAGAPIHDPLTGRIQGVLDISCLSEHSTPLMHSLVRSAASSIERNLLMERNQLQQALFDVYTRADARSRDGVIAVSEQTVMSDRTMRTMLDPADQQALQEHMRFIMQRHSAVDSPVELPSGIWIRLRGTTLTVGTRIAGMVGIVTVLHEVGGTATEPTSRPSRPNLPAGDKGMGRGARLVQSDCPAWRHAASGVISALRERAPILLLGEPGTGRKTLLSELYREVCPAGSTVVISAAEVEKSVSRLAELFTQDTAVLHVLLDIDKLPPKATDALVTELGRLASSGRRFAATAAEAGFAESARPQLVALFGASATVPPLRDRLLDLKALVWLLLNDLAPHRQVRLSPEALRVLGRHRWPGNVGELRETLAHALRRRPAGSIEPEDLPASCQSAPRRELRAVDWAERDAIVTALREAGGNRVAAAASLGLARSTLYRKIRHYGLNV